MLKVKISLNFNFIINKNNVFFSVTPPAKNVKYSDFIFKNKNANSNTNYRRRSLEQPMYLLY